MPSTLVHVAVAGLIAAGLLKKEFNARSVAIVLAVTAVIDLDTFAGLVIPGAHRALLHNLWLPGLVSAVLVWDHRRGRLRRRWGQWGVRTAWVSVVAVTFAHVLLDAFFNGANLFWPVYNQFYDLSGRLILTDQRGLVQTFVEFERTADGTTVAESTAIGTTGDTHFRTGVDPDPGGGVDAGTDTERIFPVADSGSLFIITAVGYLVVAVRLWEERQ